MSDNHKAIVRRKFDEMITSWNLAVIDEIFSDNIVAYDPTEPQPLRGKAAYRAAVESFGKAFPHVHITIDEQLAEGDSVATRWSAAGRNDGDLFGTPATGKRVEFTGIDIHRVRDGKIVEEHGQWDALGLMRQLGALAT